MFYLRLQFIHILAQVMQKLKVYLTKQTQNNKHTIEKLKYSGLRVNHEALDSRKTKFNSYTHNHSHHNLMKPTNIRTQQNNQTQTKKRNVSNSHNRSLQNANDFQAEVRNIVKDSYRYEREKKQCEKNLGKVIVSQKKNSKKVPSGTSINYKSQPHKDLEKTVQKNTKSEKNLNQQKKHFQKVRSFKIIQEKNEPNDQKRYLNILQSNKNPQKQVVPIKKRSKSANPQLKKTEIKRVQQKQNQSFKKVQKTKSRIKKNQSESEISLMQTRPLKSYQLEFHTMSRTRKGVQIMNPNKVNQDRIYAKENFLVGGQNFCLYAVADGHGPMGHLVSNLIIQNLQKKVQSYLNQNKSIQIALDKSFNDIQSMLLKNNQFNADFSGSTLVTLIIQNKKNLLCANVGDSRAIVARQLNKTSWEIIRLSNDHKPSIEEQKTRILTLGGRIDTVYDEEGRSVGPMRVWLPKKQLQGLAMSRSLGDNISKPIGVTHQPQILAHELNKDDKFILLASDGVWQFLTNYQILSLIIPYYRQNRLQDACQALLKQAYRSWTKQDNSVVDDISFILIFIYPGQMMGLKVEGEQQIPERPQRKKVNLEFPQIKKNSEQQNSKAQSDNIDNSFILNSKMEQKS